MLVREVVVGRMLTWTLLVALGGMPGALAHDEPIEPVYASAKVLRQRGPWLGRFGLQDMLRKLHPGIQAVPAGAGFDPQTETDYGIIELVSTRRGSFLVDGPDGITPTGPAVALLLHHVQRVPGMVSISPELVVLRVERGGLVVVSRSFLDAMTQDLPPRAWPRAAVQLGVLDLHPRGAALTLTVTDAQREPDFAEEISERTVYFVAEDGPVEAVRFVLRQTTVENAENEPGRVRTFTTRIETHLRVGKRPKTGLAELEQETHEILECEGRVYRRSMRLEILCWEDGAYQECGPAY
jgi:hypothetical protein